MKADQKELEENKKFLRKILKPGTTVFSVIRSVSKSGMSRRIDFYVIKRNGFGQFYLHWLTSRMAKLGIGSFNHNKGSGMRVQGCGMDMAFHCVYTLGRILYPEGFMLAKNQHGRNGDKSGFDKDGGYALKSEII